MRAVGMRRSELVGAFATEGWLYAVVATLGVLVGIGLGAILVAVSARIFASEHNRFDSTSRSSQAVWRARSHRVRRCTGDDRRHEPPRQQAEHHPRDPRPAGAAAARSEAARPRRRGIVAAAGVALTLQGVSSREGFALLLGPTLAVAGLTPFAARREGHASRASPPSSS